MKRFILALAIGLATSASACTLSSDDPVAEPSDPLVFLRSIPEIVDVVEKPSGIEGTRFFAFRMRQPLDHAVIAGPSFLQRATLLYRDRASPTIFGTSGYDLSTRPKEPELVQLSSGNYVAVEHRFFGESVPETLDWKHLTIEQAAADHHHLVSVLRPWLDGKWISTGASKGGMTAVYHRRFYPEDVDATVAYVAPNSLADPDERYIEFLRQRGTPELWQRIDRWQESILAHWPEVRTRYVQELEKIGASADLLGVDTTLELALIEAPFTLWQYGDAALAERTPAPDATADELYNFLDESSFGLAAFWQDAALTFYAPYYWQAATQLGYPAVRTQHLAARPLAELNRASQFPPMNVEKKFDTSSMSSIQNWIDTNATSLIFVYGENDPYTAAAFRGNQTAALRDIHILIAPQANHSAKLANLEGNARSDAETSLSRWLGVPVELATPSADRSALDREEPSDRAGYRHPI
jgi:hypothetical protein